MINILKIWHEDREPGENEREFPIFPNPKPQPNVQDWSYLFFESACLVRAVDMGLHKNCQFFGLVGPNYKGKIDVVNNGWGQQIGIIRPNRTKEFSKLSLKQFVQRNQHADIISLTKHAPHDVFFLGERYHPGILNAAKKVLAGAKIPLKIDGQTNTVIYFNYFIAKPEIIEGYVNNILRPFIDFSCQHLTLDIWNNSGYGKEFPSELKKVFNINYWPFAPFATERLISYYAYQNRLNFTSYHF
jgi:hypothetical protein